MPRFDGHDDDSSFERFKKRPKNPKKGKDNRSNQKQMIRDHFTGTDNNLDNDNDDFMEKWERK